MQANQRLYRLGVVGRLLSPTVAGAMRDLPLSKRGERATLAANRPESGECRSRGLICLSSQRSPSSGALVAAESVRSRRDGVPFYMVALIFAAAFGTLAISFWPYMIPFSITIGQAAAPHSSLAFMFWGEGLFVFPLMLFYTAINYTVFRGKVRPTADHY
jgi:hypothetical protein